MPIFFVGHVVGTEQGLFQLSIIKDWTRFAHSANHLGLAPFGKAICAWLVLARLIVPCGLGREHMLSSFVIDSMISTFEQDGRFLVWLASDLQTRLQMTNGEDNFGGRQEALSPFLSSPLRN